MKRKKDGYNKSHRIDGRTPIDRHQRLALEAWMLKRAWLFASAILGRGNQMEPNDFLVPNYIVLDGSRLTRHIMALKDDFENLAKHILLDWNRSRIPATAAWFADQYDSWAKTNCGVFEVGRFHEVEKEIGRLSIRKVKDCPPHALFVMQGYFGAAIRHPEYHLASDIALFYNLLLDSETIWRKAENGSIARSSQHSQSFARGVILTCYNLLESFVSGLAAEFLLEHPGAPEAVTKELCKNNASLRERFVKFPSLITGRPDVIDGSKPPFKELFGEFKQRRDSFVHCEPGAEPGKFGYIKEQYFHDVEPEIVRKTVDSTFEAICLVWKILYGKESPTWLPQRDDHGRFKNITVALNQADE